MPRHEATIGTIAVALAATDAIAQDKQPEQEPRTEPAVEFVEPAELTGMSIASRADDGTIGTIADLVVAPTEGNLRQVVIERDSAVGGGKAAVAWHLLRWNEEQARYDIAMDRDAIEALPMFDARNLRHPDLDADDATTDKTAEPHGDLPKRSDGGTTAAMAPGLHLASELAGCELRSTASDEVLGTADRILIERRSGDLAFAVVRTGGVLGLGDTERVIPWRAVTFVDADGDRTQHLEVGRSQASFEAAPKLGDEGAKIESAEFRSKVYAFWGVVPPAFDREAARERERETRR